VALPEPTPGLVIRYDYLWLRESAGGRDHGKDRPACLVAASDPGASPRFVVILPITHTAPAGETVGVELPAKVRHSLGLDDQPSWVIVSEHNVDEWPNSGLQPLPGRRGVFSYGHIPPGLFAAIKARFIGIARQKPRSGVRR
jgi:hypothetical protein